MTLLYPQSFHPTLVCQAKAQTKASDLGWSYYKATKCQIIFFIVFKDIQPRLELR